MTHNELEYFNNTSKKSFGHNLIGVSSNINETNHDEEERAQKVRRKARRQSIQGMTLSKLEAFSKSFATAIRAPKHRNSSYQQQNPGNYLYHIICNYPSQ